MGAGLDRLRRELVRRCRAAAVGRAPGVVPDAGAVRRARALPARPGRGPATRRPQGARRLIRWEAVAVKGDLTLLAPPAHFAAVGAQDARQRGAPGGAGTPAGGD